MVADQGNINRSIRNGISLSQVKALCPPSIFQDLEHLYPQGYLYCWALSKSDRYATSFPLIQPGDPLLLKPNSQKGNAFFTWRGRIIYKTDGCPGLGNALWKYGEGWDRLLFLDNIEEISIPASTISSWLGLKENFRYSYTVIKPFEALRQLQTARIPIHPVETITRKSRPSVDEALRRVCENVHALKSLHDHSERDNEALVKDFLEYCGYVFAEDFTYRLGFIDIGIVKDDKCVAVVEVKKEWSSEKLLVASQKQAFSYALEHGARFVIITNSDHYFIYDRSLPGLSFDDYLLGKFQLTDISSEDEIRIIQKLFKSKLLSA